MEKVVHKNGNKSYCPLLDVTKLIFSLVIVVYHYNYFVLNWQNEKMFGGGYLSVEVFFVISGFLLGKSICKQQKIEVIPLTVNKAKKVWLPYAIALTTLFIALFRTCTDLIGLIFQFIKELLMVQEIIPFYTNNEINGPTWYISAMLVATAIIVGIKKMLPKAGDIAITALSLFCFFVMAVLCGDLHTHGVLIVVPKGVIRALASMGLGYILARVDLRVNKTLSAFLWMISIGLSLMVCWIARDSLIDYLMIPCALGIVAFGASFSSENRAALIRWSKILGKLSLYIYLWHTLVRNILSRILESYSLGLYLDITIILAIFLFWVDKKIVKRMMAK